MKKITIENKKIKKRQGQEGITLIALIITIVILIVLAVVSIKLIYKMSIVEVATNQTENYAKQMVQENREFYDLYDDLEYR